MTRAVAIGCMLLMAACAGRGGESSVVESALSADRAEILPETIEPPALVSIVPGAGARELARDCDNPTEERCNALDDDCDGAIDEGCGYGTGLMQVTASWDTGSDIDLYVTGPLGDTLSFQRPSAPTGGRVDHSGRGDCDSAYEANPRIENIRWVGARPAPGIYEVVVHYWGECISGGGPAEVTVSVGVGLEIAGQYRISLLPGERARVVRFVVQ